MKYVLDCISDTHTLHDTLSFQTPDVDGEYTWILVHAGDYTHRGRAPEVKEFGTWLRQQPHAHKIVIHGNHECMTDPKWVQHARKSYTTAIEHATIIGDMNLAARATNALRGLHDVNARKYLDGATLLHDTSTTVGDLRIHVSPYSLEFFDWAYMLPPADALAKWSTLPDADVFVIHGPPKWHGDRCPDIKDRDRLVFVGDAALLARIRKLKPKLVVCCHIHESAGVYVDKESGVVIVNAAVLTGDYTPRGEYHRAVIDGDTVEVTKMTCLSSGSE